MVILLLKKQKSVLSIFPVGNCIIMKNLRFIARKRKLISKIHEKGEGSS